MAAAILLFPALLNLICYDATFIAGSNFPPAQRLWVRTVNIGGFILVFLTVIFVGVDLLEWTGRRLRQSFAPAVDADAWDAELHRCLAKTRIIAIACAMLWVGWLFCIYGLQLNFVAISIVFGLPAHLLAACLYLPLVYRWYRLARQTGAARSG